MGKGAKLQRANQIPKSLIEAVNGCGEVIDIRVGRKVNGWIREQVGESSIMLDEASITLLEKSVGEEIARIPACGNARIGLWKRSDAVI